MSSPPGPATGESASPANNLDVETSKAPEVTTNNSMPNPKDANIPVKNFAESLRDEKPNAFNETTPPLSPSSDGSSTSTKIILDYGPKIIGSENPKDVNTPTPEALANAIYPSKGEARSSSASSATEAHETKQNSESVSPSTMFGPGDQKEQLKVALQQVSNLTCRLIDATNSNRVLTLHIRSLEATLRSIGQTVASNLPKPYDPLHPSHDSDSDENDDRINRTRPFPPVRPHGYSLSPRVEGLRAPPRSEVQRSASPSKETFSPAVRAYSGANPFDRVRATSAAGGGKGSDKEGNGQKGTSKEGEGALETVVEGLEALGVGEEEDEGEGEGAAEGSASASASMEESVEGEESG